MHTLSPTLIASTVLTRRKAKKLSQTTLSELSGVNRSMIVRIENNSYTPTIAQLEALAKALDFDITEVMTEVAPASAEANASSQAEPAGPYRIAVAGTGYVGLSLAILLAQHNHVTAVDIVPEKVDMINHKKSPIQDDYI